MVDYSNYNVLRIEDGGRTVRLNHEMEYLVRRIFQKKMAEACQEAVKLYRREDGLKFQSQKDVDLQEVYSNYGGQFERAARSGVDGG